MTTTIAVLGAGYAGTRAIQRLGRSLPHDGELVWISEHDYHLILHEVHRCIRDPSVQDSITISVDDLIPDSAEFIQSEVTGLDTDEQTVELAEAEDVSYDYVLVALGSQTAFYGIDGLEENSLTLKSLDDALEIHDQVEQASIDASQDDPAQVVVGGAGLSGIQTAGEIAEYRDHNDAPIDIHLVEALEEIYPGNDPGVQQKLRSKLEANDVNILTDDPIVQATSDQVHFDERDALDYDVLIWTGGITGRDALNGISVENEHNRLMAGENFQTSDERVFAVGDSALLGTEDDPVPPTAQAAWRAADVAADNIINTINGEPLKDYSHVDKGTAISIGEDAVAHDVVYMPIKSIGSVPAATLKKMIAARWIADITSWSRAMNAWGDL